jgi:hypothetical protein
VSSWQAAWEYSVDARQRTALFWDVLRQRSEQYYAEKAKATPHVLSFDGELLVDAAANRRAGPRISTSDSPVSVWTIPTNEELMIARHTLARIRRVT